MKLTFGVSDATTDLPESLLCEIGKTMVLFANLEWRLSRFAYALLKVDRNIGRIAVREPRASDRFDMVCDLLNYQGAVSKLNLPDVRKRIVECEVARDLLAHATWVRDPEHNALRLVKTTGQWQPSPGHPPMTKRKTHPEAVLFEMPEAEALNENLRQLLTAIVGWAAEFRPPSASR